MDKNVQGFIWVQGRAGPWKYLYRAVDRDGDTIDFLLRAKRDCAAARRFLERAIDLHGVPEKSTIDKSGANTAAIKRIVRPMLEFAGLAVKSRAEQVEKKDLKQRLPSQKSKGLPCQFYSLEMFIVRFTSATFTRNTCRSVTTRNLN